jgi:hypothetical protein
VARWSQPIAATSLQTLGTYLQQPLIEEEKIPISQNQFNKLCVPYSIESPRNALSAEQLSTLFRVSADERARDAYQVCLTAIRLVSPAEGTEDLFHSTWDINISHILHFILSDAKPIRNSNQNTSTALKRPDYGLLVKNHCVLRGEEKGSDSIGDPKQELANKLIWTYSPLPYILGLLWIL